MTSLLHIFFHISYDFYEWFHSAIDDEASSKTTVYDWFAEFKCGRTSGSDAFCEGRPTTVIPANINAVWEIIVAEHVT